MKKNDKGFLVEIAKLFRLETMTTAGRFNLGAIITLVLFAIAYTTSDAVCYFVSAVRDAYKTWVLSENINFPYESTSVFKVLVPILILVVLCFLFLYIDEKRKNDIKKKE